VKSQRAFGEALRRHRERSGVTIESIARQTKISASMLVALERGDCSRWPTGIYSRSYVRDYAQAVGLDPDDLAAQFGACFTATAFPERPTPSISPGDPGTELLRLTFAAESNARWRDLTHRSAVAALDLLLIGVLSLALWMTVIADFWMALAGVAITCHAIGLAGGVSAVGLFASILRNNPDPTPAETPQEAAVAEPA
jgi:transcriptional regulator with XRE-family HTH domain